MKEGCYQYSCTDFSVNINFHLSGIKAQECICWIPCKLYVWSQEVPHCLLEWLNYHTFPIAMPQGPSFYASLSALDTVIIFYFNCSDRCVIMSHCGFNWHFPMVKNAEIFLMRFLPSIYPLLKISFLHRVAFAPLSEIGWMYGVGLFLGSLPCSNPSQSIS